MPSGKGFYQRGEYWLDYVRGAGGEPASQRYYIWWYSPIDGRLHRKSTRERDLRLASDKLDTHYLAAHRPTQAERVAYTVSEALTDYYVEAGALRVSADAIRARLKLMQRFIDAEVAAGLIRDPFLPGELDDNFLGRFRRWALIDPIIARKKDAEGRWVAGSSKERAASTVEESIIQLKAAMNHAFDARRISAPPVLKHKTRNEVTPVRSFRLSIDGLSEILDYTVNGAGLYGGHADRLIPLRRFVIAGIATLGRPDALLDMSVLPEREQWMIEDRRFALNPAGRIQTKKVRPILPVPDVLHTWLSATEEWFVCKEGRGVDPKSGVEIMTQTRVASVRSGWDSAKAKLGIPAGWGPKLIRYSISTILARLRVDLVELEMAMGHRVMKRTTAGYAHLDPDYLQTVLAGIEYVFAEIARKAGTALIVPGACAAPGRASTL